MDIISDYGSDVWGSNPYEPTTLRANRIKPRLVVLGGMAEAMPTNIGKRLAVGG